MSPDSDRPAPQVVNPFVGSGSWLTGCLHLHTTGSDGALTPEETLRRYRQIGYDFIAISDHESITIPKEVPEGLIWIHGVEYATTSQDPPEHWHVVSVGTEKQLAVAGYPVKTILKLLGEVSPFFFVAHPYWSNQGGDDMLDLPPFNAVEVYNNMAEMWLERGKSEYFWDYMLSAGRRVWAVAGDDTHRPEHIGGGRVKVRVQERTAEAIVTALRTGMFYATAGPDILDIRVDESGVSVKTSPVRSISFVANGGWGQRLEAEEGGSLQEARYEFRGNLLYLRIECADSEGRKAWSNPVCFWNQPEPAEESEGT